MSDLILGLAIMTALSVAVMGLAMIATRRAPLWIVDGVAALVVVGIAVYARWFWDSLFVARILPFSNLIVVSNWFPLAAGLLSGLVWRRIGNRPAKFLGLGRGEFSSRPRKFFAASVLFVVGFLSMAWPLVGTPPECGSEWQGDICLQTTEATCSPAAGATLLQNYGIYASEQEMAELCLTRRGTSWKGLYRALMLKGAEVGRRADAVRMNLEDLSEGFSEPCILQCELRSESEAESFNYQMEGWVPGQPHSVVLLDVVEHPTLGKQFLIADPTAFAELWSRENLEQLWHGEVLRLVPDGGSLGLASR
jgi:hypothetical protein